MFTYLSHRGHFPFKSPHPAQAHVLKAECLPGDPIFGNYLRLGLTGGAGSLAVCVADQNLSQAAFFSSLLSSHPHKVSKFVLLRTLHHDPLPGSHQPGDHLLKPVTCEPT